MPLVNWQPVKMTREGRFLLKNMGEITSWRDERQRVLEAGTERVQVGRQNKLAVDYNKGKQCQRDKTTDKIGAML